MTDQLIINGRRALPYDWQKHRDGAECVTRYGRAVKFVAYVPQANCYKVLAFIEGRSEIDMFVTTGKFSQLTDDYSLDLFLLAPAPVKVVKYAAVLADGKLAAMCDTEKECQCQCSRCEPRTVATITYEVQP